MSAESFAESLSRRTFLAATATTALAANAAAANTRDKPTAHQATGVRVGEITPTSAIIWTRLTKHSTRNNEGVVFKGKGVNQEPATVDMPVSEIEGACPGQAGEIRIRYTPVLNPPSGIETQESEWQKVSADTDFTHQFRLTSLLPDTVYAYGVETRAEDEYPHKGFGGRFHTAPEKTTPSNFTFCVMTCQGYPDRGHPDGHDIYPAMLKLKPKFISMTGDVVYYDNDAPSAKSPELARLHWERMFSLPRLIETLSNTGTYWLKDDHDTLKNDTWPGNKYGLLSFAEGQKIFRQQTPLSGNGYRTFRWGRDLQIWLTDGRDYRSPNNQPDGPEKTIWGAEQKAWFKKTLLESDATWKILISPTPLVGPDRGSKNDNHANSGFAHEGNELRQWLQENAPDNFFVLCGDRHWQYHSVHPETGVREFSVGAASNEHAGGSPGEDPKYHKFHRVKGGFASVTLQAKGNQSEVIVQHRDIHGELVHTWNAVRTVRA